MGAATGPARYGLAIHDGEDDHTTLVKEDLSRPEFGCMISDP